MENWFLRTFIYRHHLDDIKITIDSVDNVKKIIQMEDWAEKNLEKDSWRILMTYYRYIDDRAMDIVECFCFKKKEDLIAFKMYWA